MPENSNKNQKNKHEAKEQRKPRQSRHAAVKPERKVEKAAEEPNVPAQSKPVFEEPGPEFYKNLKRETDEILKITEEANSKYKKKEIQSNWTKYEMPIESYDEIDEQENLGADYEQLIKASVSVGGHFQFKHEKSWDSDSGPSLYDKYFEINMDNLATSLSTIPFYERNNIDKSIFSATDILNMDNRSVKYKRKYYNDKSFTTPELEAPESILGKLREGLSKPEEKLNEEKNIMRDPTSGDLDSSNAITNKDDASDDVSPNTKKLNDTEKLEVENQAKEIIENQELTESIKGVASSVKTAPEMLINEEIDDLDELILGTKPKVTVNGTKTKVEIPDIHSTSPKLAPVNSVADDGPTETKPVIESPEDLEKWLDDFLDG